MDFGDILDQWDKEAKQRAKAPTPPARKRRSAVQAASDAEAESEARALAEWLDRYGPSTSDAEAKAAAEAGSPRLTRRDIDDMPVDAVLDLHGMTAREAESAISSFWKKAEREGCRKVLIVHGKGLHSKGEPVLADVVRLWIERKPSAGRSGPAKSGEGGGGATWVLLKQTGDQRSR